MIGFLELDDTNTDTDKSPSPPPTPSPPPRALHPTRVEDVWVEVDEAFADDTPHPNEEDEDDEEFDEYEHGYDEYEHHHDRSKAQEKATEASAPSPSSKGRAPAPPPQRAKYVFYEGEVVAEAERDEALGLRRFNAQPRKGLEWMMEKDLVGSETPEVARFLMSHPGLDPSAVGEVLGRSEERYQEVMRAYVGLLDFRGLNVLEALRELLSHFRLPGESNPIERLMEAFAHKYVTDVPGRYASSDTVFLLAYALIMLQTSLHNPSIRERDRMTLPGFQAQLRGSDGGNDIPGDELKGYFDSLQADPISLREGGNYSSPSGGAAGSLVNTHPLFADPDRSGPLKVYVGGWFHKYKTRFCLLVGRVLYVYKDAQEFERSACGGMASSSASPATPPLAMIPLNNLVVRLAPEIKYLALQIVHPNAANGGMVDMVSRSKTGVLVHSPVDAYVVVAPSVESFHEWHTDLAASVQPAPGTQRMLQLLRNPKRGAVQ